MVCVIGNRRQTSIRLRTQATVVQRMAAAPAARRVKARVRLGRPAPLEKLRTVVLVKSARRAKRPRTRGAVGVRAVLAAKPGCRPKVVRAARHRAR